MKNYYNLKKEKPTIRSFRVYRTLLFFVLLFVGTTSIAQITIGAPIACAENEITIAELYDGGSYNGQLSKTFANAGGVAGVSMTFTKTAGLDSAGGTSAPLNGAPTGWDPVSGIWLGSDDNYTAKHTGAGLDEETYEMTFSSDIIQTILDFRALNFNVDGDERIQIVRIEDASGVDITASTIFAFSAYGDVVLDAATGQIKGGASYTAAGNDGGQLTIENTSGFRKIVFKRIEVDNDAASSKTQPACNRTNGITLGPIKYCLLPVVRSCNNTTVIPTMDFNNPTAESAGASLANPQAGDIFRFSSVIAGVDALLTIVQANGGASGLKQLEHNLGPAESLQTQLNANGGGDQSVEMEITFVATGTTNPVNLSFYATGLDIDGFGSGRYEYIEMTIPDTYRVDNATVLDVNNPAPVMTSSVRFQNNDGNGIAGVGTNPEAAFTAYYENISSVHYKIGKVGADSGDATNDRYSSLYFSDITYNAPVDVFLTAPVVCGTVKDDLGNGLENVTVGLSNGDTTQTDANGEYSFTVTGNEGALVITETNLGGYTSVSDTEGANDDEINIVVGRESLVGNDFVDRANIIDSDNDGISDDVDLDDDNDGVLDTDEGICQAADVDLVNGTPVITHSVFDFSDSTNYVAMQNPAGDVSPLNPEVFMNAFDSEGGQALFQYTFPNPVNLFVDAGGNISVSFYYYDNIAGSTGAYISSLSFDLLTDGGTLNGAYTFTTTDINNLDNGHWIYITLNYAASPNSTVVLNGFESSMESNSQGYGATFDAVTSEVYALAVEEIIACSGSRDTDGDGVADYLDLDADNDGISDLIESGQDQPIVDADNNGILDDMDGVDGDADDDGLSDAVETTNGADTGQTPVDTDGDGLADMIDLDADNDGIPDAVEAQPTSGYTGNDGDVSDDVNPNNGIPPYGLVIPNTDTDDTADTTPDYLDTDADGDGNTDAAESGIVLTGTSHNGIDDALNATYQDPDGSIDNPINDLTNADIDNTDVDYRSLNVTATPFTCGPNFYQVINYDLKKLNSNGSYSNVGASTSPERYNSIGYNSVDNLIYGVGTSNAWAHHLIMVDNNGVGVDQGLITENGSGNTLLNVNAGDFDNTDHLYVRIGKDLAKINITTKTYDLITFAGSDPGNVADIVYIASTNSFWGAENHNLFQWNLTDGTLTRTTVSSLPGGHYGAAYTDNTDKLYLSNNNGGVYLVEAYNTATPIVSLFVSSAVTNHNDGASCPNAPALNVNPVATDDMFTGVENNTVTGNVITGDNGNDIDTDGNSGDTLAVQDFTVNGTTYASGTTANLPEGNLTINLDGSLIFVPVTDFTGSVPQVTYTLTDNNSGTDTALVSIVIIPDNDNDGIPDITDIDDDNDGILDRDEESCNLPLISYTATTDLEGQTVVSNNGNTLTSSYLLDGDLDDFEGFVSGYVELHYEMNEGNQTSYITQMFNEEVRNLTIQINDIDDGGTFSEYAKVIAYFNNVVVSPTQINLGVHTIVDAAHADYYTGTVDTDPYHSSDSGVYYSYVGKRIDKIEVYYGLNSSNSNTKPSINYMLSGCSNIDTDGDGIPNHLDLDSDNDGIPDVIEAGGSDPDGDGVIGTGTIVDTDGDGLSNIVDTDNGGTPLANPDTDGDGINDVLDLDSDNDGIADVVEAGGSDPDGDGVIGTGSINDPDGDGFSDIVDTTEGGTALPDTDTDGDTIPNRLDRDSDNDGISDVIEAGGADVDNDGVIDGFSDVDNDGFSDSVDTDDNTVVGTSDGGITLPTPDMDGDNHPDYLDIDSDNDGLTDVFEAGGADVDGDGQLDGFIDPDGDGFNNIVDADTNNDGAMDNAGNALPLTDTDGDTHPNYLDIDADNDGIVDNIESQTTLGYTAPTGIDTDEDGLDNAYDTDNGGTTIIPTNTDGAADNPDYLDLDSDDDGRSDAIEGWDTNNDGTAETTPSGTDADHDGLYDAYDHNITQTNPTNGQIPSSFPDLDNPGGDRDWREVLAITTIEVEKTATYVDVDGDGTYNVGDRIDYVIAVENTGNVTLTNVTVSDPDATITGINPIASIASGAIANVTAEHVLIQSDIDAGTYENQATASTVYNGTPVTDKSDDGAGSGTNTDTEGDGEPDDPTVIPMVQTPELTTEKVATVPANATVGDDVTYTIRVENTGNVTVSNIQITDTNAVPATVTAGTLAPGEVFNATVTHTITQADMNAGTFDNQATATGNNPQGNPVTDDSDDPSTVGTPDDPTTVDLSGNQEVSIVATLDDNDPSTSTTPSSLALGDNVTYTLNVENTGNVDVTPVAPAGYTYVSGDANGDGVINPGEVWNYTMTHTVDQTDVDAGQIDETITVTGSAANGDTASDVSDDPQDPTDVETDAVADGEGDDVTSTFIAQTPAMEVTKDDGVTGAQALAVGSVINYNIIVTNTGDVTLTNVVVTDANADGGAVTGSPIASIAPGANATVTAVHTVTQDDMNVGKVENTAVATTTFNGIPITDNSDDADDLEPGDNDPTTTVITQNPELTVTKDDGLTGSQILAAGDVITYTIVVENTGDVTLTNIEVTDANATITAGNPITTLAPNAIATVTATHAVTQADIDAGTIENTAVANTFFNGTPVTDNSDDADGLVGGTDDPTTTEVTQTPELTVTKDDSMSATATVGDDITYTIIVENTGNVTVNNITVTDVNAVIGGNATITSLSPGATATLTAVHTITQADMNAGTVDNTAVTTGVDTNGTPVTDDSDDADGLIGGTDDPTTTDLTPNQDAELTATLTDNIVSDSGNPTTMFAGDNVNYTLNVENTGNVSVNNPIVPADYTPVLNGGNNVGDTNGDGIQDPGETWVYTSTHVLTQPEIDAGVLSTQVDVSGTAPNGNVTDTSDDPDTTADNDQTSTYFNLVSELDVIKSDVMPLFIQVGEDITYTITVTNTGNTTINNITVTDANATIAAGDEVIASLAPGAHADVTAVHTITQEDMDAGFVSNTAQASGTNTAGDVVEDTSSNDPDTPDANDPTVSALPQNPSILTVKREVNYVDNGLVGNSVGDVIEYEISVENTGDVTIDNVSVTDLLITNTGGTVAYTSGDTDNDGKLDVDETWVFTATYTVTQSDMDAGQVVNTATAYGLTPDGTPINDVSDDDILVGPTDNPTTTNLVQDAQIEITKVDVLPANVALGQYITYNLVVTNTGNVTLHNVNVADTNAVMNGVGSAPALAPGQSVTFTAVHEITQADLNAGTISNQATVTGTDPNGTDITDLSDDTDEAADVDAEGDGEPDDVTVTDLIPYQETDIEVSLTDNLNTNANNPTNMNVGDIITYTAEVVNTGNVSVTPNVPAGYIAVEQGGINVGDTNGDGVLDPGETWIYTATHTVTQPDIDLGTVTETVTFTGTAANGDAVSDVSDDPEDMTDADTEGDNEPDDNTVTYIGRIPELTITKAGTFVDSMSPLNGIADINEVIAYTITVTNTGNVTLTNVVVTDPNANILTGSPITSLVPGASATVTAEHVLTQADIDAGKVENQATATGQDPQGNPVTDISDDPSTLADNDATVTPVPVHSEVTMTKVGVFADTNNNGYADVGELVTYTFEVSNAGNQTISNVSIDDTFLTAAGATYVSGDQNGNGLLDITETWIYSGVHEITQADINAGSVDNQALVTAEDPEGNTLTDLSDDPNNTTNDDFEGDNEPDDVTNTLVPQHPEIEITKTGHFNDENSNGLADAGETISYTFVVTNTGNVTLTDVIVTDALVDVNGTSVILAPGDSDNSTFTATYVITNDDIRTGYVTNTAVAHGLDPQGSSVTDLSDDPSVVDSNPDTPTITETTGIVITTIFTPNGDGTNDTWAVPGIQNFAHNNVKIYNRWGNLVYEKDHYIGDWNGISNGRMTIQQSKLLPVGTYYYVIDLGNGHEPFVGYLYLKK